MCQSLWVIHVKKPFLYIVDHVKKCLSRSMDKLVSQADWEVVIKVVARAIPSYVMCVFKHTSEICHSVQTSINQFWWGHKWDGHNIYYIHPSILHKSKDDGGPAFRDIEAFNQALLAKKLWRLLKDPSSLVACFLYAKYFPNNGPNLIHINYFNKFQFNKVECHISIQHLKYLCDCRLR